MKKQLPKIYAPLTKAFALALLLAASAALNAAQAQTARAVHVSIPFEFVVGGERLPAGDYTVSRVLRDSEKTLLVRSADGRTAVSVHTNAVNSRTSSSGAKLVFTRHGEQYFLARVSTPGSQTARALPKSRIRRSLERELAAKANGANGDAASSKAIAEGETVVITGGVR